MDKYTGKKLDGRYEIHEMIGVGGMAVVYRAYDTIDDRSVAIKILKEEFLSNEEFIRRFKNESKAIAVLSHPNIVKVYDVSFGDKMQYIVMEYIDGITLKEYIDQQRDIKWKEAVHFTVQILRALQHAHEKGIIHRDIKPQNIMLLQDGTIKVTDFGIARFAKNETRTMTDKAIGSVHYIAPEQARGDLTDAKADLYSVGVMLYEMITGQLPFEADNAVSVAIMQLQADPRMPKDINPAIPDGLEEITLKAMQKDPAQRYQSAAEMLEDIELFRRNPSIKFQYQYFIDEKPTKYIDAINSVKGPVPEPNYDDDYAYEEDNVKTKSTAIHILGGIGIAVVLFALIFGIVVGLRSCQSGTESDTPVPDFINQKYDDVINHTPAYSYHFEVKTSYDSTKEEGIILDQDPKSTTKKYKKDATITLTVNSNESKVPVPDVKSLKQDAAIAKLQNANLGYEIRNIADADTATGVVKDSYPSANTQVNVGDVIILYVSTGPKTEMVTVPDVLNDTKENAQKKLEAANLHVNGEIIEKDSDKDKGIVLSTDPLPSVQVKAGSSVTLTVSSGKKAEYSYDLYADLPQVNYDVNLKIYVDGVPVDTKEKINPSYNSYRYTVKLTGNTQEKKVVIQVNEQEYVTYTVQFTNDGNAKVISKVTNPDFSLKDSSTPSSAVSPNPSSQKNPDSSQKTQS